MTTTTLTALLDARESGLIANIPDGYEAFILTDILKQTQEPIIYIARDSERLQTIFEAVEKIMPDLVSILIPAWDCLPYDRVSPNPVVVAERMAGLAKLTSTPHSVPCLIGVTVNAALQRLPMADFIAERVWEAKPGKQVNMDFVSKWLDENGFIRNTTVREPGEYAVRGGIIDLFVPGEEIPIRLDFFGDTLETIRSFDPETQRTVSQMKNFRLVPMSEVLLNEEAVRRFRQGYAAQFGAALQSDRLYFSVSEGRRHAGMEHWLPLFHENLASIFDYLPQNKEKKLLIVTDKLVKEAISERFDQIKDYYQTRENSKKQKIQNALPYFPLKPNALYFEPSEWQQYLNGQTVIDLSDFTPAQTDKFQVTCRARAGRRFDAERASERNDLFETVTEHIRSEISDGQRVVLTCWSEGSQDRLIQVLQDHGCQNISRSRDWSKIDEGPKGWVAVVVISLEHGFRLDGLTVLSEQDILGDRMVRRTSRKRKASDALTEATTLDVGDLVVHVEHGIGQFIGLKSIDVSGAPHDCLELHYHGGDKLYLPVENIELLSRYGSAETEATLDRLGGAGWQSRKARLKKQLLEIAEKLIAIAAVRLTRQATRLPAPEGVYEEFSARFPFEETEDQFAAIQAVCEDLASGKPMDRLICGDVGFGKTEVALRAALIAAYAGLQVAIVVPTTLLCRQHYNNFKKRFDGLPIRVHEASRMVPANELRLVKKEIEEGSVDVVVGTHALLGKSINFKNLGLLIIDEEQHFGVKHKERLKELREEVHVLTLTATPIPRTLQLALTGVRDLSLIATPPVDRLAIRTFITPFDTVAIREALLREKYRGGQSFYVAPRISDLAECKDFLDEHVPEIKVAVAHGQMPSKMLEDIMTDFYEGHYDTLLSTTIIESGLDVPTANTLIVHRAHMFGLAQLYQIRGRVGRSKTRAYALFTLPLNLKLTPNAERRLKVLQNLDTLGAGFQLASHDLDIRGSGNLLGEEQSGHIREVGFELYQQMLEEAVASLKMGDEALVQDRWSPNIALGGPVMIPEDYVADLHVRMSLYRRLADLESPEDIDAFGAELIDRFGTLPEAVEQLMKIMYIKGLCRKANIEKVDAGSRGVVLTLRDNYFANGHALMKYIQEQGSLAQIRPDQRIFFSRQWENVMHRVEGVAKILTKFVEMAENS